MSCSEFLHRTFTCCLASLAMPLHAAEYVIGLGAEFDTEYSNAYSVFGSFAVAEESWLSATASRSHSEGMLFNLNTVYADAGYDHFFGVLGVRVGAAYWGDEDLLDSSDLRAALYWKNERASISIDYEHRAFDLTIPATLLSDARTVEFEADGVGASLRLDVGERASLYAGGMHYDYSRDIAVQPNVDRLRIFALSRLSMVNSLLDDRISGGIEFNIGSRVLDFRAASWRTAVFGDRVDSLGVGLLSPLGKSSDIEFRLASDDSDAAGRAAVLSVFLYLYGE